MEDVSLDTIRQLKLIHPTQIVTNPQDGSLIVCEQNVGVIRHIIPDKNLQYHFPFGGDKNFTIETHTNDLKLKQCACISLSPPSTLYLAASDMRVVFRYSIIERDFEIIAGTGKSAGREAELIPEGKFAFLVDLEYPYWLSLNHDHSIMAICDSKSFRIIIISLKSLRVIKSFFYRHLYPLIVDFLGSNSLFISSTFGVECYHDIVNDDPHSDYDYRHYSNNLDDSLSTKHPMTIELPELICGNLDGHFGFRDGHRHNALFQGIMGMIKNISGDTIYLADCHNHRVRMLDLVTEMVSTIAGNGIPSITKFSTDPLNASISFPTGLSWVNDGNGMAVTNASKEGCISIIHNIFEHQPSTSVLLSIDLSLSLSSNRIKFDL